MDFEILFWVFFITVVLGGVHWSSYESSYNASNISYLKSPLLLLSFIPLSTDSWNSFNRYHVCIFLHVYTLFVPPFAYLPSLWEDFLSYK
jgi:hypothetical protein